MKYYSDFYKTIDSDENAFFIGANTFRGFAYADPDLFNETKYKKLYIIKGGPGTGKSSIMKKCRKHFKELGAKITSYYCSSDPDSLDAIIIEHSESKILIADGTPPHSLDASIPGAISEIINLGDHWNSSALSDKCEEIARLAANKAIAFDSARKYIAAAGEINSNLKRTAEKGFDKDKATRFIQRLISSIPKQKNTPDCKRFITEAISMKGAFRISTFEAASELMGIIDYAHIAPLFFEKLSAELEKHGHTQHISYSPLGDIVEIHLPIADISFVPAGNCSTYNKVIRLSRFADKEYFSQSIAKRRFNERCLMEVLDGALASLSEAKDHHFALEDLYINAMDFDGINEVCHKLIREIERILL